MKIAKKKNVELVVDREAMHNLAAQIVVATAFEVLCDDAKSNRITPSGLYVIGNLTKPNTRTDLTMKMTAVMFAGIVDAVRDLAIQDAWPKVLELADAAEPYQRSAELNEEEGHLVTNVLTSPFPDSYAPCSIRCRMVPKIPEGVPRALFVSLRAFLRSSENAVQEVLEYLLRTPWKTWGTSRTMPPWQRLSKRHRLNLMMFRQNGGFPEWEPAKLIIKDKTESWRN